MKKVTIQKQLVADLRQLITEYNKTTTPKLKIDVAVFFVGLINEISTHYRIDDLNHDDFVPLYSDLLKHYHSNYKEYFEFLVANEFLDKKNYGADIKRSNSYKVSDKYNHDELISFSIEDKSLNKKFNSDGLDEYQQKKLNDSRTKRPHLMAIFNETLTIEFNEAMDEIDVLKETEPRAYKNARVIIEEFHDQKWKASIKPYTDNRLHTNLTRSPKVIRKHLRYNGERLVGCDIKTSQPYFFCVLLKAILDKDYEMLENIQATRVLNGNVIEQLFNLKINREEVTKFISSIVDDDKDFYEDFQLKLDIKEDENGRPYRVVSNFKTRNKGKSRRSRKQDSDFMSHSIKYYKSHRDLAKQVVMEVLYSSPMSKMPEAVKFRQNYPSIHRIIRCFYENNVKFSQLLTTIEAYILLDVVANHINQQYPEIPLASIHDCIVTTEQHQNLIFKETKRLIKQTTNLKVNIEKEEWN